jgi:RNA polymerase sigma-70 factor (ECF subfamily)
MLPERTTEVINRFLADLQHAPAGSSAEPMISALLSSAVERLHVLCASMLHRSYRRLAAPPMNLQPEEMLGAVVIRLLRALKEVRPTTVRQFFALANQHMRWELNDLARRLDDQTAALGLHDFAIAEPASSGAELTPNARRILEAIEGLPPDEQEVFNLVRVQGMTHPEAAEVVGVSAKTIQRRLNRSLVLLSSVLGDLKPVTQ